jgi:hypothetical protein
VLLDTTDQLVRRQADMWAGALAEVEKRAATVQATQQTMLATALESAIERTLQTHAQRLAALEGQAVEQGSRLLGQMEHVAATVYDAGREQQGALSRVAGEVAAQAEALTRLVQSAEHLIGVQNALQQNLAVLAGAGAFEEAVHSLAAAVHLLTARASAVKDAAPVVAFPALKPSAPKAA